MNVAREMEVNHCQSPVLLEVLEVCQLSSVLLFACFICPGCPVFGQFQSILVGRAPGAIWLACAMVFCWVKKIPQEGVSSKSLNSWSALQLATPLLFRYYLRVFGATPPARYGDFFLKMAHVSVWAIIPQPRSCSSQRRRLQKKTWGVSRVFFPLQVAFPCIELPSPLVEVRECFCRSVHNHVALAGTKRFLLHTVAELSVAPNFTEGYFSLRSSPFIWS